MVKKHDSHSINRFHVERGEALPFGATELKRGINFSLLSEHASAASLILFNPGDRHPAIEIPLDPYVNRTGHIWHIFVRGLDPGIHYLWRLDGPQHPDGKNRFNPYQLLLDPYSKVISGGETWGKAETYISSAEGSEKISHHWRSGLATRYFDWGGDVPPRTPLRDTVIYELHVRGYTVHPSSGVKNPGTYLGLTEKIPYLKELGVTAVELMPVFEFDENENLRRHPRTGELLLNIWGYSPISFFAPKASYASNSKRRDPINGFRHMVKEFHKAGIEVFIDVVYNHTGEGDDRGPTISFRGIDNSIYYMLDKKGSYLNFSGCGNTLNCNHPYVRTMIIDSLRYWVSEMHIDGFRFDLASIMGRGLDGRILENPPLVERISIDPVLADTKIIAEAWDAAGLYQVGSFPNWGRWAEWNSLYRDHVRMFWKGEKGMVSKFATRLCGSDDLYNVNGNWPFHSINFITAHDGFTLNDLVSYNQKHNEDNGENNWDGAYDNYSMNFGVEGPTGDSEIKRKRMRQMKNLMATLLVSQGIPMILGGDEFCRTQYGNNNAYCQDNEIGWVDWRLADEHREMLRFTRLMIEFRKRHPNLRRDEFFIASPGILWHGEKAHYPDWSEDAHWIAFLLERQDNGAARDCDVFIAMNAAEREYRFEVPNVGKQWRMVVNTAHEPPHDIYEQEHEAPSAGYQVPSLRLDPRSVIILTAP